MPRKAAIVGVADTPLKDGVPSQVEEHSMTMIDVAPGWILEVERGSDWLFVRVSCQPDRMWDNPPLGEMLWGLLEQNLTHRLVLECDRLQVLHSALVGQLVLLHKRITTHGGIMRISGLSESNQRVLQANRLDDRFPNFLDRSEAVLGYRPKQPR